MNLVFLQRTPGTRVHLSQHTVNRRQNDGDVIVTQIVLEAHAVGLGESHADVSAGWRHEGESELDEERELGSWLDEELECGEVQRGDASDVEKDSVATHTARQLVVGHTKNRK